MPRLVLVAYLALATLCSFVPASHAADTAKGVASSEKPAAASGAGPAAAPATPPKPAAPAAAAPAAAAAAPGAATPAAKPTGPVPPESMNGLSFEGLTDAQKQLAISILNDNSCDCGCGMKLAVCRRDDAKCTRSLALSNQVIDLVKQGKTREEIVKVALTPPSKFVSFDLKAGDAPAVGPADAKVVILHYLDYQ